MFLVEEYDEEKCEWGQHLVEVMDLTKQFVFEDKKYTVILDSENYYYVMSSGGNFLTKREYDNKEFRAVLDEVIHTLKLYWDYWC